MNGFALILRLARREMRGGLTGFRVFLACLTLGVAAISGVGSLSDSIVAGLRADARTLLGGDVELRLQHRPATDDQLAYLRANAGSVSEMVRMRSMARRADGGADRSLIELKAVDHRYPLVGTPVLDPPLPLARALDRDGDVYGAVVDENLLVKMGLGRGDRLRIGETEVVVRAIIRREPDRVASVVSFGPRVMIAAEALPATGLIRPGSQVRYYYRMALAPGAAAGPWIERLKTAFPEAGWRIRGPDDAAPGIRRFIERMSLFLSFVGLTALLIGGIGVSNAVKSYLDGKTETIATLKCLGATGGTVFRVYLVQILGLAALGIGLGLGIGGAAPALGLLLLGDMLPVAPRLGLYPGPLALAAGFGLLTAVTFALWPLARAREIPAANLFRDLVAPTAARPRAPFIVATVLGVVLLAALAIGTASDRFAAAWFVGGALATFVVLRAGAGLVMAAAARVTRLPGAEWRLALANLHRPGASTPSVVVSLGLGLAVLVAVVLIEGNLSRQVNERLPEEAPALFFIDVQPDQVAEFDAVVTGVPGASGFRRVPSLRGRIIRIAGRPVEEVSVAPGAAWAVRGDRALTYAAQPSADSRIVAGTWWPEDYRGSPLISLDAGLAQGFGVGLGDSLTFNVLGRDIEATITSLREIDWRSLRFDFAVIFAPGTLEGAPQTHIAAVHAPPESESRIEKAVTDRFSNVSAIRVREALEAAARILAGVGTAVRATASVTVLAGILVLAGAVAAGRRRRLYDAVVFKVLGATRRRLFIAFLLEYGCLGIATGAVAAAIGSVTAWAVVVHLMEGEWTYMTGPVAVTVAVGLAVTLGAEFAGTWRALGQKAAPYLRNQ